MTDRSEKGRVAKVCGNPPFEGFVVYVPSEWAGRDVYVAPLREGEPVPGETWDCGGHPVVVKGVAETYALTDTTQARMLRVRFPSGVDHLVRVSDLTPLPKKKRPEEIATELHALIVNGEHRAHALVDELLEAARASLSVEEVGDA